MGQLFGKRVSIARGTSCRIRISSRANDKIAAVKFRVLCFYVKKAFSFFNAGNGIVVVDRDIIFPAFMKQDLQNIRGIAGIRKYFPVFIGNCLQASLFEEIYEILVRKVLECYLQEFIIIAVMFQEIADIAHMRHIAPS